MGVFSQLRREFETILYGHEAEVGLRTIIAVYSTGRGPALGGTRIWPYQDEQQALADVLRLAKAMAYKAAAANLPLGGGKAVIIADPQTDKTPQLLRAYGRQVERLGGSYVTTADVGSTVGDLDVIAESTRHITGTSRGSGDPSPVTAHGVWHGLRAVAEVLFGEPSLEGRHVVIQGVGKVGAELARRLAAEGAQLTVADVRGDRAEQVAAELRASVVNPREALEVPCDIFSPCALGSVVTEQTLGVFKCRAIAGAANNQLASPDLAQALAEQGILYAPDYVINAGGLINVADELSGYNRDRAYARAAGIADTLREVFRLAERQGVPPSEAADRLAEERIDAARRRTS